MFRKLALSFLLFFLAASPAIGAAQPYSEAPMLHQQVADGELPPVGERLPTVPMVVGPGVLMAEDHVDWEPGVYGGVLRSVNPSPNWHPDYFMALTESLVAGPGFDTTNLQGNVLESFTVTDDNTLFTFRMREGLRWSDGAPVTTEDIRFTFEDVLLNEELTPYFPAHFRSGGNPAGSRMELEILDDYTFTLAFDEAYGEFLTALAVTSWVSYQELLKPSHYLKAYHIEYTSLEDMAEDLAAQELDDEWWELFLSKDIVHWSITNAAAAGFPVLSAWMPVEGPSGVLLFERNPYYFKVDTEGNQLPYIDYLETHEVTDWDVAQMRIISGEVDYISAGANIAHMPMYREHGPDTGFFASLHPGLSDRVFFLNLTYDDPAWREVVQDVRFRKALSMAIDRDEIADTVYLGMASITDTVPAEFDPEAAAALLDEIGLDRRDSEGYRLGPDGEVFDVFIEVAEMADITSISQILVEQLSDVGLQATMRIRSDALLGQRRQANEAIAGIQWLHNRGGWANGLFRDYLPSSIWARSWELWYASGGADGEEPPEWVQEIYSIHDRIMRTLPTSEEGMQAVADVYRWTEENVPFITLVSALEPVVFNENLGNVPNENAIDTEINLRGVVQLFYRD